jgi:excisionase family DNA binding protein
MTTGLRPAAQSASSSRKKDNRLYLPVREVAETFGVSRSTIVRAYQAGEFPAIKFRGTYRVPRLFVDEFHKAALRGHILILEDYARDWIARHGMPEAVAS